MQNDTVDKGAYFILGLVLVWLGVRWSLLGGCDLWRRKMATGVAGIEGN